MRHVFLHCRGYETSCGFLGDILPPSKQLPNIAPKDCQGLPAFILVSITIEECKYVLVTRRIQRILNVVNDFRGEKVFPAPAMGVSLISRIRPQN